jgi:hypothetical protein
MRPIAVRGAAKLALALWLVGSSAAGCATAEDPTPDFNPEYRWPMNGTDWAGFHIEWAGTSGFYAHNGPSWKGGVPDVDTLNNLDALGLHPASWKQFKLGKSACGLFEPSGVEDIFIASSGLDDNPHIGRWQVWGPTVWVKRSGGWYELAEGETVVAPVVVRNGYLASATFTVRMTRVGTAHLEDDEVHMWPAYKMALCDHKKAKKWRAVGIATFLPFGSLPEAVVATAGGGTSAPMTWHPSIYQPVAMPLFSQTAGLQGKFAIYGQLPVPLHGETTLDLKSSAGQTIPAADFLFHGGVALGNGSPVTIPTDSLARQFWAFFTKAGQPVYIAARAGDGGEIQQPAGWHWALGSAPIPALQLSSREADGTLAPKLDMVAGQVEGPEIYASRPSHAGSGRSRHRQTLFEQSSNNPRAYTFSRQLDDNKTKVKFGSIQGAIESQEQALGEIEGRLPFALTVTALWDTVFGVPDGPISPDKPCDFERIVCTSGGEELPPASFALYYCGNESCDPEIGESAESCLDCM